MTTTPSRHGTSSLGHLVHHRTADHLPSGTGWQKINKAIAMMLTRKVGSMNMFWVFNLLSLLSLPATLVLVGLFAAPKSGPLHFFLTFGWIYLITWVCQNYIQLVLLPALMVGQNLQNEAADARNALMFDHTNVIMDKVNENTDGGIQTVLSAVETLRQDILGSKTSAKAGKPS